MIKLGFGERVIMQGHEVHRHNTTRSANSRQCFRVATSGVPGSTQGSVGVLCPTAEKKEFWKEHFCFQRKAGPISCGSRCDVRMFHTPSGDTVCVYVGGSSFVFLKVQKKESCSSSMTTFRVLRAKPRASLRSTRAHLRECRPSSGQLQLPRLKSFLDPPQT